MTKATIKDQNGNVEYSNTFTKPYEDVEVFMKKLLPAYGLCSFLILEEVPKESICTDFISDKGNPLVFVTKDEEDLRFLEYPHKEKEDFIQTEYGIYPKVKNFVIGIYDWYNTIEIQGTTKVAVIGNETLIIFDTETLDYQYNYYR